MMPSIEEKVRDYRARPEAAKRDTANPCRYCGWSRHTAIHQQSETLNAGPGPYHRYVPREQERSER